MNKPLRCAILSYAHVHASSYAAALARLPATTLMAIWDEDTGGGRVAAERFGVPFAPDLQTLLSQDDLDAVLITAETVRHRELCEAASKAEKHILCEKPLATSLDDAEAMIAAAEARGVILATAFPMRHNLPARRLKALLDQDVIGRVLAIRATNHGTLPPGWFLDPVLAGGGAVMDHTVHVADLLRWYLGEEPFEVYAEISHGLHHVPVEDAAFLTISFPSEVIATLDPTWSRPPSFPTWGDVTMEIAGERGTLHLDVFAQKLILNTRGSDRTEWISWGADADEAMIADFAQAVRKGRRPAADGRDGERALAVALTAYVSARLHQAASIPPADVA